MSSEFGRPPAAELRGASAGSISGAASIAAHGWASGGMAPGSTTLALLVAGSTVIGALVAGLGPLRTGPIGLIAALVAGQLLGHGTLTWGSAHTHHESLWTPTMLAAHVLAAAALALVILGAETAYRTGSSVLARVLPALFRAPAIPGPAPRCTSHRDRVILRILAAESFRTRGPPRLIRL